MSELIQIGKAKGSTGDDSGISRRRFLQIIGSGAALTATGCADSAKQNIFPNVKGEREQIPGVAVWYSSTCGECDAGCGIRVRTREGRAVKIEGNPDNPINQGGLCALGQSALQSLYDPDRIREPSQRDGTTWTSTSWEDALSLVKGSLKDSSHKRAFITGELSGSLASLVEEWCKANNAEHITFDLNSQTALAKASEAVYGTYGIPKFHFDRAEVILNFGADFLETWISPVEYASEWAKSRRAAHPARVIHVEPRLSLTGANADLWLQARPGSELKLALIILKQLLALKHGTSLRDDIRESLEKRVGGLDLSQVAADTGISVERILLVVNYLHEAKSSLILAGGSAAMTSESLSLAVVTSFLNLILGNVGETVNISSLRTPQSSTTKVTRLIESMNKGEIKALFVYGTNPQFALPSTLGFSYALKSVPVKVNFSSHFDETSEVCNLLMPTHTSLESWGDSNPMPGIYSMLQPTMTPVFNTRGLGDTLINLTPAASQGSKDFLEYLKNQWKKVHEAHAASTPFQKFWLECVERGGYFDTAVLNQRSKVKVDGQALQIDFKGARFESEGADKNDLILFPYTTALGYDGRGANRPWLQELPDPITHVVWDTWAELHPDTAKRLGIEAGDPVTIRNQYGEVHAPAYISKYVHPEIIAVPMGQGHTAYGRYAKVVGSGNVMSLLNNKALNAHGVSLLSARANVTRGRGKGNLVTSQGSDTQMGRELARMSFLGAASQANGHNGHHNGSHAENGQADHHAHDPKQMYVQREHPLYRWGMAIDLNACTGCSACVVACYAENNIAVVGKTVFSQGRELSWLRIERYYGQGNETPSVEDLQVNFLPMLCQHCGNAPCEPVCPVYATYHNEEGLNAMVYNRCVGTRYCSNNCPYKVRRFNWFEFDFPEPLTWQLNPDVTKRTAGVMEKCTFCVQRINAAKDRAKDLGRLVEDGEVQPACVQSCPTKALTFGNLNDPKSAISKAAHDKRAYKVLDHHVNSQPAITYLERVKYKI